MTYMKHTNSYWGTDIMSKSYLIKYAEIALKGKNRHLFEEALVQQIRYAVRPLGEEYAIRRAQGRIYVDMADDVDEEDTIEALRHVFGIVGICPIDDPGDDDYEHILKAAVEHIGANYPDRNGLTFKVMARRARKDYFKDSMEINADAGEAILEAYPGMKVDVHDPEIKLYIEIRETVSIYSKVIPGPGGMPVGTSGKAMLLLSGGIDSPVAGYMIAKRGVKIDAVYFHAPPYTSERAKQKVVDLARIVSAYTGPIYLHVINFTAIQMYIYEKCPHDELTIIMRRYMMHIAQSIAEDTECMGLITGESIGQVASQTMHSLACTDEVCQMPVYRPLIGFDKNEIVEISQRIGTFETSILPYEDCCTIFVAKHPVTKPRLDVIKKHEQNLSEDIDRLVKEALDTDEVIIVKQ